MRSSTPRRAKRDVYGVLTNGSSVRRWWATAPCTWDVFSTLDGYGPADTRVSRNVEEMTAQGSATPAVPLILAVRVIAAKQDLLEAHPFDGRSHQLVYRPTAPDGLDTAHPYA